MIDLSVLCMLCLYPVCILVRSNKRLHPVFANDLLLPCDN